VGIYIIKEAWEMTGETVGSLVDKSNPELEGKIKDYLKKNGFNFEEIKTRRIGNTNFAEVFLLCDAGASMEEVDKITTDLKNKLLEEIDELSYVTVSVKSLKVSSSAFEPKFWGRFGYRKGFQKIGPKKKGKRIVFPLLNNKEEEIHPSEFGVEYYLIVDIRGGKIQNKQVQKNPYFTKKVGKGVKFLKSVEADKVLVKYIGKGAKDNLKQIGVEVEIVDKEKKLQEILETSVF
jgi:predicted Fe-Mo cluster-binding NifX family protein